MNHVRASTERHDLGSVITELKQLNGEVVKLELLLGLPMARGYAPHLEIDFLSECNLRCVMCHQSKHDMGRFRLSLDEIDSLIEVFPMLDTVMIAGLGEPLLYKRIDYVLPFLSRYQCRSHLFTNGMLIDKRLSVLGHLSRVSVSIDGDNADTFEKLRPRADFRRITSNVELLAKSHPQVRLATSTVLSTLNVGEIAGMVNLAARLGMHEVHLSPVNHTPELHLRPEDEKVYAAQLAKARDRAKASGLVLRSSVSGADFESPPPAAVCDDQAPVALLDLYKEPKGAPGFEKSNSACTERRYLHQLDRRQEVAKLASRRDVMRNRLRALRRLASLNPERLRVPSCTAPWLYRFARSNGRARLCPYADIDVGNVNGMYLSSHGADQLHSVRYKMGRGKHHFSVCHSCTDDHRSFRIDELRETLAKHSQDNRGC